ncbi:PQQ-binding-like beta-propeller repeat protein [Streptomyces sp. NPDC087903]|uniref:outer membrane protein assembly factor BamB family protein n=1 Tax=Streptomyces sp. NPDC087903 TaxID=3365819 RepID=UPI0037FDA422
MSPGPRKTFLACLAVLLAAVLAGGGWALWGRTADGGSSAGLRETVERTPHETAASRLFTLDPPKLKPGWGASTPGSWATGTSYVKTESAAISAYSLPEGKRLWRIPLDGEVCGATPYVTTEGRTAVVFRSRMRGKTYEEVRCDRLLVFDVDDGRTLRHTALPRRGVLSYSDPEVTISGDVVAVNWDSGSMAYPVTGGKALWTQKRARCRDGVRLSGGGALVRMRAGCAEGSRRKVSRVDPRTGRPLWTYEVPRKYWTAAVLSTDPVVVAASEGDTDEDHEDTYMTHLLSLDEHGRLRATIPLPEEDCFTLSEWDSRERSYAVTRDTLYLPTLREKLRHDDLGAVVALDLRTGKVRKRFAAEAGRHIIPLRMSGDRLLALQTDDGSGPRSVVKVFGIDPATGHRALMLRAESSDQDVRALLEVGAPSNVPAVFEHGRLFLGRDGVTGPRRGLKPVGSKHREPGTPGDRYLGVVFGAG